MKPGASDNGLSDAYAMGGKPLTGLNIVGAADKATESSRPLGGGHTIEVNNGGNWGGGHKSEGVARGWRAVSARR